ncbi:MAG: MFS transporter [Bryobacterales bacterium]|nr:MFS transporter [Bryobacterales bacterium]
MAPIPTQTPAVAARNALAGFFLSGILMSFLGAMLPAWGYHLLSDYSRVGYFFLSLNAGMLLSVPLSQALLERRSLRFVMTLAPALAAASFFFLAAVGPPRADWLRLAGVFVAGLAAGLVNAAVFTLVSPVYQRDRAATLNLSGLLFGSGCLVATILVAGTYYIYTTGAILIFLGLIPSFLAGHYGRTRLVAEKRPQQSSMRQAAADFKSPAAILFALLLFFQFGNEWALAGWGPLFLAQRLGIGPDTALWLLTLYWLALIVGRALMQAILPVVRHGRLLLGSVLSAMLGCLILSLTNNKTGAGVALLLIGGGFAAIYPLVVEKIGDRFPDYHPGLFNGLFSFAVTGGLLSAASLGFWAEWLGIGVIMAVPLIGSVMVFFLLVAIWIEAKWLAK